MRRLCVVLAGILPALAAPPPAVVERGDLTGTVVLSGTLVARQAQRYQAPVTGSWRTTLKWLIEEGRAVEPGDLIASLDPANLATEIETLRNEVLEQEQARALRVTNGERERLEKQLQFRQAEVAFHKARLDAQVPEAMAGAKDFRERQLELERKKKAQDQAALALKTQQSNLANELAQIDLGIGERRERLARAEAALQGSTITAGVAGIVVHEEHPWFGRKIRAGDTVNATQFIAQIPDLSSLEVEVFAGETEAGRLAAGQPVRLRLDAHPARQFTGRVRQVNPAGETREAWGSSRYFRAWIALSDADPQVMKPGMSVQAEIPVLELTGVLLVPIETVYTKEGQYFVKVAQGAEVEVVPLGFDEARVALDATARLAAGARLEVPRDGR